MSKLLKRPGFRFRKKLQKKTTATDTIQGQDQRSNLQFTAYASDLPVPHIRSNMCMYGACPHANCNNYFYSPSAAFTAGPSWNETVYTEYGPELNGQQLPDTSWYQGTAKFINAGENGRGETSRRKTMKELLCEIM
jgi:hypothetical protein